MRVRYPLCRGSSWRNPPWAPYGCDNVFLCLCDNTVCLYGGVEVRAMDAQIRVSSGDEAAVLADLWEWLRYERALAIEKIGRAHV